MRDHEKQYWAMHAAYDQKSVLKGLRKGTQSYDGPLTIIKIKSANPGIHINLRTTSRINGYSHQAAEVPNFGADTDCDGVKKYNFSYSMY